MAIRRVPDGRCHCRADKQILLSRFADHARASTDPKPNILFFCGVIAAEENDDVEF
jgi:hypothetical protein